MEAQRTAIEPGTRFLHFWLNRLIGRGGIGEVWEITNKGKLEALKLIQAKWLGDGNFTRRMVDEGELLVRIKHPNVVLVHETGMTPDGQVWIRMELLKGETLREVMNRRGLISVALACTYMRSAGHAAHQCHVIGAVHRDIKPENLFITNPEETVKLLDFGIAKLYGSPDTGDGQRHGTPLYMAPEQIRGHRVTPATDVYALGLLTYEVLCGANPFVDDPRAYDLYALYYKHFTEVPAPLTSIGIPGEISDVVAKALAKDPKDRHQNGLEFAEALWGAWCIVREREPGWDTEPGEPTKQELLERPVDGLSFGTDPSEASRPSPVSGPRPSRTSRPSRISLVHRAVERAKAEPLPEVPREPGALVAFLEERASRVPPAPRAEPEEPARQPGLPSDAPRAGLGTDPVPSPIGERAPAPVPPSRLAPVVDLAPRPRFVPVQDTVPLPPIGPEASVHGRVEGAAPAPAPAPPRADVVAVPAAAPAPAPAQADVVAVPRAAPVPAPAPPRVQSYAATEPYLPPPPPYVAASTTQSGDRDGTRAETSSAQRRPGQAWAEVPNPARAGIRPVRGADIRFVNPRLAGTFPLPAPLAAAAQRSKASRGARRFSLRVDHVFAIVAVVSVCLATVFVAVHVARARHLSAPAAGSEASADPSAMTAALPSASAPPAASSTAPATSAAPVVDSSPEPARAAPPPTALRALQPQVPPATTAKRPRPRRDVIDPWAR